MSLRDRARVYASDWRDGLRLKVGAASLFLFFACLSPAIAFGGLMSRATGGAIGVVEMIVATAVCGTTWALIAGQPLTILGGTGPLLVFTTLLWSACQSLGLAFLPVYAWVGLWSALFLMVLGLVKASRLIELFTRFTDEIFAALISLIFIVQALQGLHAPFTSGAGRDTALFSLLLGLGTFGVTSALSRFRHSPYLKENVRHALADFGPAVAVISMVLVRRLLPDVELPSLEVPREFSTTSGRPWVVSLFELPTWAIFAAAAPALLVAILLFLNQNITVRIVERPEHGLRKSGATHWDLALVGVLVGACSVFGLPWLVAATVRSINHVQALEDPPGTIENRVSPLVIHLLLAGSLLATGLLREVPMAVLYGLFLSMGFNSLRGSQFFERLGLWFTDAQRYPEHHFVRSVPRPVLHLFTAVQLGCLGLLWLVKSSPLGLFFPLFIALLVPARKVLARVIPEQHLRALDREEPPEEAARDVSW